MLLTPPPWWPDWHRRGGAVAVSAALYTVQSWDLHWCNGLVRPPLPLPLPVLRWWTAPNTPPVTCNDAPPARTRHTANDGRTGRRRSRPIRPIDVSTRSSRRTTGNVHQKLRTSVQPAFSVFCVWQCNRLLVTLQWGIGSRVEVYLRFVKIPNFVLDFKASTGIEHPRARDNLYPGQSRYLYCLRCLAERHLCPLPSAVQQLSDIFNTCPSRLRQQVVSKHNSLFLPNKRRKALGLDGQMTINCRRCLYICIWRAISTVGRRLARAGTWFNCEQRTHHFNTLRGDAPNMAFGPWRL